MSQNTMQHMQHSSDSPSRKLHLQAFETILCRLRLASLLMRPWRSKSLSVMDFDSSSLDLLSLCLLSLNMSERSGRWVQAQGLYWNRSMAQQSHGRRRASNFWPLFIFVCGTFLRCSLVTCKGAMLHVKAQRQHYLS